MWVADDASIPDIDMDDEASEDSGDAGDDDGPNIPKNTSYCWSTVSDNTASRSEAHIIRPPIPRFIGRIDVNGDSYSQLATSLSSLK